MWMWEECDSIRFFVVRKFSDERRNLYEYLWDNAGWSLIPTHIIRRELTSSKIEDDIYQKPSNERIKRTKEANMPVYIVTEKQVKPQKCCQSNQCSGNDFIEQKKYQNVGEFNRMANIMLLFLRLHWLSDNWCRGRSKNYHLNYMHRLFLVFARV